MEINRLFDYLTLQSRQIPNHLFLSDKLSGQWKDYTFAEVKSIVDAVSEGLLNLGIKKDDKIALCAINRPEWNFIDLGCLQIGAVLVPLYPTASANDFKFIFTDAEVKLAFLGSKEIYDKVHSFSASIPSLQEIFSIDELDGVKHWKSILPNNSKPERLEAAMQSIVEEDLATIIYTSGTTGNPKGVMLTHKNMVSNLKMTDEIIPFYEGSKSLSFLPLCHVFERIVFFAYLKNGIHISYAESIEKIGENLKEVKPLMFTTVPRLLEKVYDKIMDTGHHLSGLKKKLFFWAIELGQHYELNKDLGFFYRLQLSIARKLIFKKWKEALGGNISFIVTGAAPLQARLGRIFSAAGIAIVEGYGLSEASPGICINGYEEKDRMIGTVGLPLPGIEVKLATDGEILAKGSNIMKGYYKRPDLTAEVIDKDGFLHTGDIGEWVEGRFLKITDRKKELFKTSGGKYVAPAPIENKLKESRFIEQVMLLGDNERFISALIVPSFLNLEAYCKENNIVYESASKIIDNEKIKQLILNEVENFNKDLGQVEKVKKVKLLANEWTIEAGELTPTLKVKRKVVIEKYQKEISELYSG